MNFVKYSKLYFLFSAILIITSLAALLTFGLKLGIDLSGGSILEIEYQDSRPSNDQIKEKLAEFDLGEVIIQPTAEKGVIIRMKDINEETHQHILTKLRENQELTENRFEGIGPTIGRELMDKTKIIIIVSLLAIVFYIAFAFRKVRGPIKGWQYGLASLVALTHDILIPLGVLAVLSHYYTNVEISIPIIVALLTILGYSINNTVVVFDRTRENLTIARTDDFEQIIDDSLHQTLTRCINTSLTTLFPLLAIFFFGGETLKYFSLTLIIGFTAGTYSSLFLASTILVFWQKRFQH